MRAIPPPVPSFPEHSEPLPAREITPLIPPGPLQRFAVVLRSFLGHRPAAPAQVPRLPLGVPRPVATPPARTTDVGLDRGIQDIRRTDPGFDPSRFIGYAGMMFRDAQSAWTTRDLGALHDRLTPELHGALQRQCDRLRSTRRVNRIEQIEITAAVTEAWQESRRDYVTAHISGSVVDYTVDEGRESVVDGSRTKPRAVEEFWTFTRPAGLNFWMLSAIQT